MLAALRRLSEADADQHGHAAAAPRRRGGRRAAAISFEPMRVGSCRGRRSADACRLLPPARQRAAPIAAGRRAATTSRRIAADARARRTPTFQRGADDPIPENARRELLPLAYFPIDPGYNVPAALKPTDDTTVIEMPTSTGATAQDAPRRHARVHAEGAADEADRVRRGRAPTSNSLFVPFSDLTSGTETYAAGRYHRSRRATRPGIYELDFNRAYHPVLLLQRRRTSARTRRRRTA